MNKYFHCDSMTILGQKELNGPMVALELDVLKAAYDGQVHHLVCHKGWRHCEKNRHTMEHEHPHHSIDALQFFMVCPTNLGFFYRCHFQFSLSRLLLATFHFDISQI